MIHVRVGQEDDIDSPRIERERITIAIPSLPASLEQPAVEEKTHAADLDKVGAWLRTPDTHAPVTYPNEWRNYTELHQVPCRAAYADSPASPLHGEFAITVTQMSLTGDVHVQLASTVESW